ncbi:hypothetical protein ABIF50_004259 [Bradyrhizobium diazoefficiens]
MSQRATQHISVFLFRDLVTRQKMGYAGLCVEDMNETWGVGVEHHRQAGLHP